jgi:hypothetical protein
VDKPGRRTHEPAVNVAAVPGGLLRFWRERRLANTLTGLLLAATLRLQDERKSRRSGLDVEPLVSRRGPLL